MIARMSPNQWTVWYSNSVPVEVRLDLVPVCGHEEIAGAY